MVQYGTLLLLQGFFSPQSLHVPSSLQSVSSSEVRVARALDGHTTLLLVRAGVCEAGITGRLGGDDACLPTTASHAERDRCHKQRACSLGVLECLLGGHRKEEPSVELYSTQT